MTVTAEYGLHRMDAFNIKGGQSIPSRNIEADRLDH
jgi:hypothetical protein